MSARILAAAFLVAGSAACLWGDDAPQVTIAMEPTDLTTQVANSPLVVRVQNGSTDLVQKNLRLRDLANDTAVPFDVAATEFPQRLSITPRQALGEGWYELSVEPVPQGAFCRVELVDATGRCRARFHPGSSPVLQSFGIGKKPDGKMSGGIRFSEAVPLTDALVEQCLFVTQPSTGARCPAVKLYQDGEYQGVDFQCSGFDLSPVRVELKPGIVSKTGSPLSVFGGGTSFSKDIAFKDEAAQTTF